MSVPQQEIVSRNAPCVVIGQNLCEVLCEAPLTLEVAVVGLGILRVQDHASSLDELFLLSCTV